MTFSLDGLVPPCKVNFHNLPNESINFETIHTGVPYSLVFSLKNETPKIVTAYQVQNPLPGVLTFIEPQGYLTEKVKNIEVKIEHREAKEDFSVDVPILIRGGPRLILKILARIVQPEVFIVQEGFDFGGVSFNEPTTRLLTFRNNSKLPAEVIVNLNSTVYLRDFKLILPEKLRVEKGHLVKPLEKEYKEDIIDNIDDDDEDEVNESHNEDFEDSPTELREFKVEIPPNEQIDFDFIICPNSLAFSKYNFDTNFKLVGVDECKGLIRRVTAEKMESAVTLSDTVVEFPKTFIYGNEKSFSLKEIKIGNVYRRPIRWEFKLTEEFINNGIFNVLEKKGVIPGNQDSFSSIKFSFSPQNKQIYTAKVTLQITDDDGMVTNKIITLKGEGTLPRLYFDKRELILPVVPLGFESSITFKVKNDGYENEEINAYFESYPQGTLPLEIIWLDNVKTIGYMKNELRCEVKFKPTTKPCSFTTRLIFHDKDNQQFPIFVVGTSDNCLFTNYSFFQRNDPESYEIVLDKETYSVNLRRVKDPEIDLDFDDKKSDKNLSTSFQGSSVKGSSGKIKLEVLEASCRFLKSYIKNIHLDERFKQNTGFKNFPDDVMRDNGDIIYIIIANLTGKEPPGRIFKPEEDFNKRAHQLRNRYNDLLRVLQENGALLNTVLPEYLMDFPLYKRYVATDPNRSKILGPKWDRNLQSQWMYINKESWIMLLYQILKIYYLSRVNLKTFPLAIRHLPPEVGQRHSNPKFGPSNIYSNSEYLLLKWVNAVYDHVNPSLTRDVKSFSSDFHDSTLLSAIVLSYFPREEKNISKKNKTSSELKVLSNKVILDILKDYGIYTNIKLKNLGVTMSTTPNSREMVLFLTMLYQNLQHFYHKAIIPFSCILGDSIVKAITLFNPTKKPLEYAVKFDGSECFVHPGIVDLRIEPDKEVEYPVTFKSKLSALVEGKVYFINRKPGWSSQAAPIVYILQSNVTGRRSIETKIISTPMYRMLAYKLQVKSPFRERGEFEIRLEQRKKLPTQKKGRTIKNPVKSSPGELLYKAFFLKGEDESYNRVRLNPDAITEVTIFFLPVETDIYECDVIFVKDTIGEFQYTIEGRVERPQPQKSEIFERSCNVDEIKEFDLEIKIKNNYLESALQQLKPMETPSKKITSKTIATALIPNYDKIAFSVESNKPYYVVPPLLYPGSSAEPIKAGGDTKTASSQGGDSLNLSGNMNISGIKSESLWLKVKFSSKICMVYEGDITLINLEKPSDIRVYKLFVDVKPKTIRARLEFFCPVKEAIIQKIPIENKSDKDWTIKGELTGPHSGFFKHESEKRIPRRQVTDYLLTFQPTEKVNVKGQLKLLNNFTQEVYYYDLIGNVEDPLAEGNVEFSNVSAKEIHKKTITLDNPYDKEVTYTVETDLDEIVSGPNTFTIRPGATYQYEIKVRPLLGKIYFGRIIFRDDRKNYRWYTIKVEAKSTFQTQTLEMKTKIRKGVYIEINLENPTNESAIFRIDFDSDIYLFGEKDLRVEANSSKNYQLLFAPLKVGLWEARLHIFNERIGEFLYKLKLISEEQPVYYSELIKAELGKYVDYPVILENPTYEEIEVSYTNSNKRLFQVIPEKIILPSGANKEIFVRYTPSSLEGEEECYLRFETSKIGKWEYNLRGKGIPPNKMECTYVSTYVGGITSGQVNFKNPLNEKVYVSLDLKCEDWPDTFSLLNKRDKYPLEPFRNLIIPFTFSPQKLTKFYAEIYVYISKTLFWVYPIEGITEVKSKGIDFTFKTKAKKLLETKVFLDLSNLPEGDAKLDDFGYTLNIKEEKYQSLINKCLSINIVNSKNSPDSERGLQKLPLEIKFYPLRPFKTDCEFVLLKKSGGQWVYNIILEATEPDPDDIIPIKSSLGKISYVSFKLQNIFTKNAKFIAYFSHDSSSEFSVSPREGILDQSGREGSTFLVSYLPVEYGKVKIGKLIIETDEIQWIFEVRGTHLDYKPPEVKNANIHKMTKATMSRIQTNENEGHKKRIKEIKETRSKSRSRSRSRSKSVKRTTKR